MLCHHVIMTMMHRGHWCCRCTVTPSLQCNKNATMHKQAFYTMSSCLHDYDALWALRLTVHCNTEPSVQQKCYRDCKFSTTSYSLRMPQCRKLNMSTAKPIKHRTHEGKAVLKQESRRRVTKVQKIPSQYVIEGG
jgi:hypothetical protein